MEKNKIEEPIKTWKLFAKITAYLVAGVTIVFFHPLETHASSPTLYYTFNAPGVLEQASSASQSSSPYFWLSSGAQMIITSDGVGETLQGALPVGNSWHSYYATHYDVASDNGAHPQNMFLMLTRNVVQDSSAQIYFNREADNISNPANNNAWNGEAILMRYQDANNYYYAGIRVDGYAVIRKRVNGTTQTIATRKLFFGTYDAKNSPDLIPLGKWNGVRITVENTSSGPKISLYTDMGRYHNWQLALSVLDDSAKFGSAITSSGRVGVESDFADAQFDDFAQGDTSLTSNTVSTTPSNYDNSILQDNPSMFLKMNAAITGSEKDQSGHGNNGYYQGGTPNSVTLPNGDIAADFNGVGQYLTVPSSIALSIPTTHELTWEAWVRPDSLQFQYETAEGYVDWMGKCQNHSPTCEWEARMYDNVPSQARPSRFSAYAFNNTAQMGSGAAWQPTTPIAAGQWLHVVAEYQTETTPYYCSTEYPGSISIWINGVKRDEECMSSFSVTPQAGNSPLNIATMALDTWFKGAIGKVAIYNHLLLATQIQNHYIEMTAK